MMVGFHLCSTAGYVVLGSRGPSVAGDGNGLLVRRLSDPSLPARPRRRGRWLAASLRRCRLGASLSSEVADVIYTSALVQDWEDSAVDEVGFYRIGIWLRVR